MWFTSKAPLNPEFSVSDIPDLTGKVVIVTGANAGIGKVTARELLRKNAKVYAACRSEERAKVAIEELKRVTGKDDIHFLRLDLGDLRSCVEAAEKFLKWETRLDLLINSAGLSFVPPGAVTRDGHEMFWGSNVMGHYAFTKILKSRLMKTGMTSPPGSVRIVWVSSGMHGEKYATPTGIDYDSLRTSNLVTDDRELYGNSKLGIIHLSNCFAEDLQASGVLSVAIDPGAVNSDVWKSGPWYLRPLSWTLPSVDDGALTQLFAATSPTVTMEDTKGYFMPYGKRAKTSHPKAMDSTAQRATLGFCEEELKRVMSL